MARTAYSTDGDLVALRSNIMDLGIENLADRHKEAFAIINKVIIKRWYKDAAAERGYDYRVTQFDPDKIDLTDVSRLAALKTLELVYMNIMKDGKEADGFERQMGTFRELYNEELKNVLALGISYDWDDDGSTAEDEKYVRFPRRLTRV